MQITAIIWILVALLNLSQNCTPAIYNSVR
nr:MAG TPA: hypothetical protein [Caudoviricetes sp.]